VCPPVDNGIICNVQPRTWRVIVFKISDEKKKEEWIERRKEGEEEGE
jgi:hypothetical protein